MWELNLTSKILLWTDWSVWQQNSGDMSCVFGFFEQYAGKSVIFARWNMENCCMHVTTESNLQNFVVRLSIGLNLSVWQQNSGVSCCLFGCFEHSIGKKLVFACLDMEIRCMHVRMESNLLDFVVRLSIGTHLSVWQQNSGVLGCVFGCFD